MKLWPFKREASNSINEDRTFVPLGSGGARYGSIFSPPMAKCLNLYTNFLSSCPLKCSDKKHPLYLLLKRRPCPWMSRTNFYRLCVERYFVFDGFFAIIKTNGRGEIVALLPYTSPSSVQVYPVNYKKNKNNEEGPGDFSDPEKLYREGFFFRDFRSRTFAMDEMLYIRSSAFNTATSQIEQESMAERVFNNTFEAGSKLEAVLNSLCSRDLRPPLLLSGLGFQGEGKSGFKTSASETEKVKEALRQYFDNESQGQKGVLALPPGYTISSMSHAQPANLLVSVNELIVSNMANYFNVPRSLIFSANNERDGKEARRQFISGGFKSFTTILSDEYNRLAGYNVEFSFDLDKLRIEMSDLREESSLAQMTDEPIYKAKEIKEKIEQN